MAAEAFRSLSVQPRQNVPIYTLIEGQFGERVTHVQQDISAASLDAANARLLKAKAGSPALHIVRRYQNARDQTIEVALNLHPAGRFTYSEDFVHDWSAK
jgi:DNA-binding GntR family transcriptional regulator